METITTHQIGYWERRGLESLGKKHALEERFQYHEKQDAFATPWMTHQAKEAFFEAKKASEGNSLRIESLTGDMREIIAAYEKRSANAQQRKEDAKAALECAKNPNQQHAWNVVLQNAERECKSLWYEANEGLIKKRNEVAFQQKELDIRSQTVIDFRAIKISIYWTSASRFYKRLYSAPPLMSALLEIAGISIENVTDVLTDSELFLPSPVIQGLIGNASNAEEAKHEHR